MEGLGLSLFPRINRDHIKVWDAKKNGCCGFLMKKAGKGSLLNKGKWQSRFFQVKIDLTGHENYTLSYYHGAELQSPSQPLQLDGASLSTLDGNVFKLDFKDGSSLELDAESHDMMVAWVETLSHVIEVATARGKALTDRVNRNIKQGETLKAKGFAGGAGQGAAEKSAASAQEQDDETEIVSPRKRVPVGVKMDPNAKAFSVRQRSLPSMRLDIDVNSIPARSQARMQFEEMLTADVCRCLQIDTNVLEIYSVKGMLGMDWLTVVEFDLYIHKEIPESPEDREGMSEEELLALEEELETTRMDRRNYLLHSLADLIKNPHSALYNGFVTCKLDPTFPLLGDAAHTGGAGVVPTGKSVLFSPDAGVLSVMEKYRDVQLSSDYLDMSHFEVQICFEGQVRSLQVPNPTILRRRCCAVHIFEVKQALGLLGTAQELWVEPNGLVPRGLPNNMSDPIYFAPSSRAGGAYVIHASKLKANLVYDVICDDYRTEVLQSLSAEEQEAIRNTFHEYDLDGDGTVSKSELEELIRGRTVARRAVIDQKYEEFVAEANGSADGIRQAEAIRRTHYQQLNESQTKLMHMFDAADIDGNGKLSLNEFMLAEAWWMRCTMNPDHVPMF
jgi:hypothetical protein